MAKKSSYVNLAAGNLSERVQMAMVRKAQAAKHLMTASYAKTRRAKVVIFSRALPEADLKPAGPLHYDGTRAALDMV